MPSAKIQCDYDGFSSVANDFAKESGQTEQLLNTVKQCVDKLEGGAWIGVGAEAFYAEMRDLVVPAMDRLRNVLNDASEAAKRIADIFKGAEEEAGSIFRV